MTYDPQNPSKMTMDALRWAFWANCTIYSGLSGQQLARALSEHEPYCPTIRANEFHDDLFMSHITLALWRQQTKRNLREWAEDCMKWKPA